MLNLEMECLVDLASTAEWRRLKAVEHPTDDRNSKAAAILQRLATEMGALEGSELHGRLSALYATNDEFSEVVSEELRAVGFYSFPSTAEALLQSIADRLSAD